MQDFLACGSFALMRVEREGGTAAWLGGILEVPSVQGHRLPQLQLWLYQSLFLASAASNQKASLASPSLLLRPFMQLEVSLAWAPSLLLGASGT